MTEGITSTAPATAATAVFTRKSRLVTDLRNGLPTLPQHIFGLNRALEDGQTDLQRAKDSISLDPSLAAQVLQIANSLPQSGQTKIGSVPAAVQKLGRERLESLALTCELLVTPGNRAQQSVWQAYWQHSALTASLSHKLAQSLGYGDPEMAYAAGLLHDIGILAFLADVSRSGEPMPRAAQCETALDEQRQYYGLDHCELGRWIGISWNLPAPLIEACSCHHDAQQAKQDPLLTGIVAAADQICEGHGVAAWCLLRTAARKSDTSVTKHLQLCLPDVPPAHVAEITKGAESEFGSLVQEFNQRSAESRLRA